MDIQSARALKQEIATEVVPPAVAAIHAAGGFSITTFALEKMTRAEPLVALGVAPGPTPENVLLAVRLQRHSLERAKKMLSDIRRRARDEIDIRFVGRITPHAVPWYRSRLRPLQPGLSVGHYKVTAGTIGALASESKSGRTVILSNNHVLANENDAKAGDAILQAGSYDGGKRPKDIVGKLNKWVKLMPSRPNLLDAATAMVTKTIDVATTEYRGIGTLAGTRTDALLPGTAVAKVGRTTGVTRGRVSAIELDNVVVAYDIGNLSFDNQIEIESTGDGPFSAGGDSGSLILDDQNCACGLLFAGSETGGRNGRGLTYANPIDIVVRRLAIRLPGD
ncbi:MAG: S1 family peptidase [Pseudolabrys sp.]|nr:S1 family peptidase [Pseudolabrys sp.]